MRTLWYLTHLHVNYSNRDGDPRDILLDIHQSVLRWKSMSSNQLQNSERLINTIMACHPATPVYFLIKSFATIHLCIPKIPWLLTHWPGWQPWLILWSSFPHHCWANSHSFHLSHHNKRKPGLIHSCSWTPLCLTGLICLQPNSQHNERPQECGISMFMAHIVLPSKQRPLKKSPHMVII